MVYIGPESAEPGRSRSLQEACGSANQIRCAAAAAGPKMDQPLLPMGGGGGHSELPLPRTENVL